MQDTNMTTPTSPFAPADIPDINSVPASGAMPPMGPTPSAGDYNIPMPPVQAAASSEPVPNPAIPSAGPMPAMSGMPGGTEQAVNVTDIPEPKLTAEEAPKDLNGKQPVIESQIPKTAPEPVAPKADASGKVTGSKPVASAKPVEVAKKSSTEKPVARVEKKPTGADLTKNDSQVNAAAASVAAASVANIGVSIENLLEECVRAGASDLHLQVGLPPILRVDGVLRQLTTYPVLTDMAVQQLVFSTLDANQKVILMKDKEFDYSFAFGDIARFRVNAFYEKGNMAAAFRLIPNVIRSIEDLGLPGVVATFADHPNGLVLVTGPTGSGKSTTLAALVDKINTEKAVHIITIEDPIEFTHTSKRAVVAQREVHYDTYSFAAALRSILREDPDVVLIGEMRDLETIQAAITVAETGHLVFATLHTNSAAQSIDRMVDVFPAHQQPQVRAQLANILVGICSQRLVPAIDGGRIAITEIMVTNSAVRSIIREGKTHQLDMTIQTGMSQGMQTMDRELAKYVKSGVIAYDVAREYAVDVAEFDRLARG